MSGAVVCRQELVISKKSPPVALQHGMVARAEAQAQVRNLDTHVQEVTMLRHGTGLEQCECSPAEGLGGGAMALVRSNRAKCECAL